jgi:hypothetical protein
MKSDKPTKKRNTYNEAILTALATKYGYSVDYIRKCLRNDRTGIMPDQIKKDYQAANVQSTTVIAEQLGTSKQ